jgi:hypothetical protein
VHEILLKGKGKIVETSVASPELAGSIGTSISWSKKYCLDNDLAMPSAIWEPVLHHEKFCGSAARRYLTSRDERFLMRKEADLQFF